MRRLSTEVIPTTDTQAIKDRLQEIIREFPFPADCPQDVMNEYTEAYDELFKRGIVSDPDPIAHEMVAAALCSHCLTHVAVDLDNIPEDFPCPSCGQSMFVRGLSSAIATALAVNIDVSDKIANRNNN